MWMDEAGFLLSQYLLFSLRWGLRVEAFRAFVTGPYQTAKIDFENKRWHTDADIKDVPGWYFVTTNALVSVLATQTLWDTTYIQKRSKKKASVKNYNLAERADYNWTFSFLRLDAHFEHCDDTDTILKLGEQMWRLANGCPLLCAE